MRRAVFPGTFDPITLGHIEIVERALPLFDEVIVAIGHNPKKDRLFSLETSLGWIEEVFKQRSKIKVDHYQGLTTNYCVQRQAEFILRGIRNTVDFEFEKGLSQLNKKIKGIETVFLCSGQGYSAISSSLVRDIMKNGGDPESLIPKEVIWRQFI